MAWRSLTTMPTQGDFMIAEYAPTNWAYRCVHVSIPPSLEGERAAQFIRMRTRWARAWRPLIPAPTTIPDPGK